MIAKKHELRYSPKVMADTGNVNKPLVSYVGFVVLWITEWERVLKGVLLIMRKQFVAVRVRDDIISHMQIE